MFKKILFCCALLIGIITLSIGEADAASDPFVFHTIKTHQLPFSIYLSSSTSGQPMTLWWTNDNHIHMEKAYYAPLKIYGQDAYCLNHLKNYSLGVAYRVSENGCTIVSPWLRRIYAYGKTHGLEAQVLLWYLSDQNVIQCDGHGGVSVDQWFESKKFNSEAFAYYYAVAFNYLNPKYFQDRPVDCKDVFDIGTSDWKVCTDVARASKPAEKIEQYFKSKGGQTAWYYTKQGIVSHINNMIDAISKTSYTNEPNLAIYIAEDSEMFQNILAPVPAEYMPTCTNILGNLKEEYGNSIPPDELNKLKQLFPGSASYLDRDTPVCSDKKSSCTEQVTTYNFIKSIPNPRYSPKAGNAKWLRIYGISGSYTNYKCNDGPTCLSEKDKFSQPPYNCSCDILKEKLKENWDEVKTCNSIACVVECNKITMEYTCKELLPSYSGVRTDTEFEAFKKKITDPEKATHLADGTISCEPCKPDVKVPNAICDVQGKVPSNFTLSDAVDEYGKRSETCYHNNISYQIDGIPAKASIDENFSKSPYCDVYCWESVFVDLPNSPSAMGNIIAGSLFYWGINQPEHIFAELQTKRVCWTKPDYVAFANVWNANETAISQAYADYMAEVEYNKQGDSDVTVDSNKCCPGEYTAPTEGTYTKVNDCPVNDVACASSHGCGVNDCDTSQGYWGRKSGGEEEKCSVAWGKTYKLPSKDYTIPGTTIKGTSNSKTSGCTSGSVSANDLKDYDEETKRKAAVAEKVGKRNTLREQFLVCQSKKNINESSMYDYSKASIKFTTDTKTNLGLSRYGVGNANLVGDVKPGTVKVETNSAKDATAKTFNCSGINGGIGDSTDPDSSVSNICEGQTYISVDNYETNGYEWDYSGVYAFYYPEDYYFLSKKVTAEITNDVNDQFKPTEYEKEKNLYYIEGYGFPVGFTTTEGYFFAKVEISGLGHKGHFDDILNQTDSKEKYGYNFKDGYSCPYYVYNPLYQHQCHYECDPNTMKCKKTADSPADCCDPQITTCDKGKLAVVYRLIDMGEGNQKKIFPSIDGDGRKICSSLSDTNCIGANWASFISKKGGTPFKNITTTKVIYDNTPMYTIELTPTNIGKIRKDNTELRESGKDPYTSYVDAKNKLKITCDEYQDETKSCVSSYITTLMNGNYKVITGGSFKITNESQRLKALRKYKTCYDDSTNPSC